jgi:L-2-hydroxyglutarate oxidase LhgO
MNSTKYDVAVIGGGIIGLATAMTLVKQHPDRRVVVIEKEAEVARHQTGHNSGVIHAGIYYAPGSQKANFCYTGNQALRRYCDEHGIRYEMCGKLIVATDESELGRLDDLFERGTANGVDKLELVGQERLREIEPHSAGIKAVWSPETGIVDYTEVCLSYVAEFTRSGGEVRLDTEVLDVRVRENVTHLETNNGVVEAAHIINCAGLYADVIARQMKERIGLRIVPFRGEYFSLKPERTHLVNGLIYPVPDPKLPFLGVHFTKRVDGSVEAGPNAVLALAREGYKKTTFDAADVLDIATHPGFWRMSMTHWLTGFKEQYRSVSKGTFVKSLQKLMPEIRSEDMWEPNAGVRAQAVDNKGRLLQDFSIVRSAKAIHVLNAPSPAATSSLPISRHIVDLAKETFGL